MTYLLKTLETQNKVNVYTVNLQKSGPIHEAAVLILNGIRTELLMRTNSTNGSPSQCTPGLAKKVGEFDNLSLADNAMRCKQKEQNKAS